jgi:hypothetical protein
VLGLEVWDQETAWLGSVKSSLVAERVS